MEIAFFAKKLYAIYYRVSIFISLDVCTLSIKKTLSLQQLKVLGNALAERYSLKQRFSTWDTEVGLRGTQNVKIIFGLGVPLYQKVENHWSEGDICKFSTTLIVAL
jgi:hypothetical protein